MTTNSRKRLKMASLELHVFNRVVETSTPSERFKILHSKSCSYSEVMPHFELLQRNYQFCFQIGCHIFIQKTYKLI